MSPRLGLVGYRVQGARDSTNQRRVYVDGVTACPVSRASAGLTESEESIC